MRRVVASSFELPAKGLYLRDSVALDTQPFGETQLFRLRQARCLAFPAPLSSVGGGYLRGGKPMASMGG